MFSFMEPQLKQSGVSQYLLEVLTSNTPALNLYRKLGFKETRTLAVFRSALRVEYPRPEKPAEIREIRTSDWRLFQSFWDSHPSWQCSIDAVERIEGDTKTITAHVQEECVGYGTISTTTGLVLQLAVARDFRRQGIGTFILSALQADQIEPVKVNNIDEKLEGALSFYEANGFILALKQFEMVKHL
jgi:ribosomal protein S18 acetylase RimI-like enzyme